jgi:hypothetical protein
MLIQAPIEYIFAGLFVLAGVALLFVRVDSEKLRENIHTNPMLALYRFRVFRYGVAAALFIVAAAVFFGPSR